MRMLGTIVVGMVALLGSPALADELPVIKQARATWGGCDFLLQVQEDSTLHPYYPPEAQVRLPLYRIIARRVTSSACAISTDGVAELGNSHYEPNIAITATDRGILVAYSSAHWARWYSGLKSITLGQLNPSSLGFMRSEHLRGSAGSGTPGAVELGELIIHPGYVEVSGPLSGSAVFDGTTSGNPYPIAEGNHFVALFPDFFGPDQRPPVFSIYSSY